ncbi:hypothetical protein A2239_02640 [Candidatus Uhrbacteria bacterium RIFOXYA2_FULL_40_9]|nr:MAG: hypothetical protein A2239_02640 [Candidatus Uhrbacteria bacterium RIFOXYA2_FULL_40_9]
MKPKVALIYLSYFSEPYLDEVILSLSKLNYPKDQLMLIIVENASTDRSDAIIREQVLPKSGKELPEIIYLPQEKNTGFASGNNLGIQRALLEGAEYVYFLNNDAKLQSDALRHAIALAESDVKIGSVQSLMLLWQNPQKVNSTGGMVHFLGFGFVRDNGEFVKNITAKEGEEIAYASGAAVLYRARTLQEVGLLDPYLFLYHEDLELGWRIRLAGYRNVLSVKSIAYHHYEFSRSIQKYYWMERNRLFVHFSHLKLSTLVLLSPWLFGL